jgi:hypothetical protein
VPLAGYDNNHLPGVRHIWLTTVDNASHEVCRRCDLALMARVASPTREAEDQLVTRAMSSVVPPQPRPMSKPRCTPPEDAAPSWRTGTIR